MIVREYIPIPDLKDKEINRFKKKFIVACGCWIWVAGKGIGGYGRFGISRNGKQDIFFANRISYYIYKGNPGNLHVLHKCDNPSCINPDHLFLGTDDDNNKDMIRKGRGQVNKDPKFLGRYLEQYPEKRRFKEYKLNLSDIDNIKVLYNNGLSAMKISKQYKVCETTIFNILKNKYFNRK